MNEPYADQSQPILQFVTKPCFHSTLYAEAGNLSAFHLNSVASAYIFNTIPRSSLILFRIGPVPDVPAQGPAAAHNHVQVGASAALRCPRRNEHLPYYIHRVGSNHK